MKKHLRGRRYIRSRASVRVDRFNKQTRKTIRFIKGMQNFGLYLAKTAATIKVMAESFSEIERMFLFGNPESPKPKGILMIEDIVYNETHN